MVRPVMTRTTPPAAAPAPPANTMTNGVTQNGNGTHQMENGVDSGSGSEDDAMDTVSMIFFFQCNSVLDLLLYVSGGVW